MPKHGSINLYVHGNQKASQDGQPRTSTSTLTQLLNYEAFDYEQDDLLANEGILKHSGNGPTS